MLEWKLIRLGDICLTNKSSYSSKDNWKFVNYLDTGSLTENKITELQYINIEMDKMPSRARRKVIKNSILYSTVRPNQLHYGIIKEPVDNLLVSTGFTVIDVDTNKAIPEFIYYLLTQNNTTEQLQAIAEQSVSTYPSIKPSDIENLEFKLPNLIIQSKIVSILDTIDNKIRQNEKINNNLLPHLCVALIATTQLRQTPQTYGCLHMDGKASGRGGNAETPQFFLSLRAA